MLRYFGWTRNGSVATPFILFSSTVASSAIDDDVAVPERFGQNEVLADRNEERTRNKHSSAPKMYLNDPQWNHVYF